MTRTEALAPLKAGEARVPGSAGLFMRGNLRRAAVRNMIDFYEEKGMFSSEFKSHLVHHLLHKQRPATYVEYAELLGRKPRGGRGVHIFIGANQAT